MIRFDGKGVADSILDTLTQKVRRLKKTPKLVIVTVTPTAEVELFIRNKKRAAEKIGAELEVISYKKVPKFENFVKRIKKASDDPSVTGIVIQKPLPASLATVTLYKYVDILKEIEGVVDKSTHLPPLGQAVVTAIINALSGEESCSFLSTETDCEPLKTYCKRKKVLLVGRGESGGIPIGKTLSHLKIPFINIQEDTQNKEEFYNESDIIITSVGKNVLDPSVLKQGVWLISTGYRNDGGLWKGDYDENSIADIAGFYTPTPGGMGPVDIAYVMSNLVTATENAPH